MQCFKQINWTPHWLAQINPLDLFGDYSPSVQKFKMGCCALECICYINEYVCDAEKKYVSKTLSRNNTMLGGFLLKLSN